MAFLRNLLLTAGLLLIGEVAAAQGVGSIAGGGIPDGVSSEPNANEEGQGYVPPGASDSDTAIALMSAGSYDEAIPVLERIVRDNPKEAESLFYLGFANSKLHRYRTALDYYLRAEKADPEHKGVRRYLGELYLHGDDLAHAEAELAALRTICTVNCKEREDLAALVSQYRQAHPAGSAKPAGKAATGDEAKPAKGADTRP